MPFSFYWPDSPWRAVPPRTTTLPEPPPPEAYPSPHTATFSTPTPAGYPAPATAASPIPPPPRPTLSRWEQTQKEVSRLRNLLDSSSDGYAGLGDALEQPEANEAWCNGLTTAINDFNYISDAESANTLETLETEFGCP